MLTLLIEMALLSRVDLEAFRKGQVTYLERVVRTNLTRLARIQTGLRRFARTNGLQRVEGKRPRRGRYSKSGLPFVEAEYAAVYAQPTEAASLQRAADKRTSRKKLDEARRTCGLQCTQEALPPWSPQPEQESCWLDDIPF